MELFFAVKQNMQTMLEYSQKEYALYKKTQEIVYMQQAGEKLFNAIENYIQFKYKNQARSFFELKNLVRDKSLKNLLYSAKSLHQFFYNGELEMDVADVEELYLDVLKQFLTILK